MSAYIAILVRRTKRWEQMLGKDLDTTKLKKSSKLERFVQKGVPMSLRGSVWMMISGALSKREKNPDLYNTLLTKWVAPKDVIVEQVNTDSTKKNRPGHNIRMY